MGIEHVYGFAYDDALTIDYMTLDINTFDFSRSGTALTVTFDGPLEARFTASVLQHRAGCAADDDNDEVAIDEDLWQFLLHSADDTDGHVTVSGGFRLSATWDLASGEVERKTSQGALTTWEATIIGLR